MLENKRVYRFFAGTTLIGGLFVFVVSLLIAMAGDLSGVTGQQRRLYFDRKILPDHIFYPVLVTLDRLELELAEPAAQTDLRLKYAHKRLQAAEDLAAREQFDLAFVTLGKAHQYLLQVNQDVAASHPAQLSVAELKEQDLQFVNHYLTLKPFFPDNQQASVEIMVQELLSVERSL